MVAAILLWTMVYRPWTTLSLLLKKLPHQFRAFIFFYPAGNNGFWMGDLLIQPAETEPGIISAKNDAA